MKKYIALFSLFLCVIVLGACAKKAPEPKKSDDGTMQEQMNEQDKELQDLENDFEAFKKQRKEQGQ